MADTSHAPAHVQTPPTEGDGVSYSGIVWFVVILVVTTLVCQLLMWVLLRAMRREDRRLARGWTYEPPTFYEVNEAAAALDLPVWRRATRASWLDVAPAQPTGEWAAAPAVAMASATARMART